MKKLIYILAIGATGLFASCDDFLDQEPADTFTSVSFWQSEEDVIKAMPSLYSSLYLGGGYGFAEFKFPLEAYREDYVSVGVDASNYPDWGQIYSFTNNADNNRSSGLWWYLYRGISHANQLIAMTSKMSDAQISPNARKELLSEAHFMRGYYNMQLILNWKEFPLRNKYITSMNELNQELASRQEAWSFIIDEFQKATDLPAERPAENKGRATKGAAYAYLGWANLTLAYEQPEKEKEYLDAAIQAFENVKGYELEKNFLSMFNGTRTNTKESIFEVQYSGDETGGAFYKSTIHKWMAIKSLGGWDEIYPTEKLAAEFKKEGEISTKGLYDSRFYATMFTSCDYFNEGEPQINGWKEVNGKWYITPQYFDDLFFNWVKDENGEWQKEPDDNAMCFRKFIPEEASQMYNDFVAINIPLMRYANVLLMKAEALNKLGRTSEAIPLINMVRDVHGDMPPMKGTTQSEVFEEIKHQRMMEFPLESYRWYDMRRWGITADELQKAGRSGFTEERLFFPIPESEEYYNGALSN